MRVGLRTAVMSIFFACAAPAFAGVSGNIEVKVTTIAFNTGTPQQPAYSASYGEEEQPSYVSYVVTVDNVRKSNANKVELTGLTSVTDGAVGAEAAVFV